MSQQQLPRLSRRGFLGGVAASATAAILAACGGSSATDTPKPAASTSGTAAPAASAATTGNAPTSAPAQAAGGKKKTVLFWGRQQFLPESNDYLSESVKMAAAKGGFDVKIELFSNDEHPQKEVVAMESGVVPDITYTYAPALWNQNGYAMEVQSLYDEIGKSGGGWLDLADGASKTADGKRINVPMNSEPWFVHLRRDKFEEVGVTLPFKTFDEMMNGFKKVNKPDQNFFAFDGQMTEADWGGNGLQWMWMFGGRLFDKEGNPTINTPQNIAGLTAYTDLFKNKMMPPGVVSQQASGNNEAWLSGQTACVSNPGSIVLAMRKDNKDLLKNTYLQAWPSQVTPGTFVQDSGSAALVINKKSQAIDESMQVARMILSPDRYPTQLEKAGSYWFPIMKNYINLPFFTQDEWNKEVTENIVPYTLAGTADTGLSPIFDDITISAPKDMMQAVVVNGKSPTEAIKILADAADKAKAKFSKK
jgi:ABC-type glycerol-3-phosphate transport system substrate-binding protein